MKTSNPVLARLGQAAERERAAGYAPTGPYGQPGYPQQYPTQAGYPAAPPAVNTMSIDDVVVKTVTLLGILGVSAAAAWALIPDALLGVAWIGAAMVGLVLGLIISFSRMANPALVVAFGGRFAPEEPDVLRLDGSLAASVATLSGALEGRPA